jgi:ribosomal protein L11 methyltransferase
MRFGANLWIVPSWTAAPDAGAVNILLDPGLAFGTGTHPTTRLCLEWLDAHPTAGQQVIDYGCGSGILAIAAARLGAGHVWAVDNDPQALTATRDNAGRNEVTAHIDTALPAGLPACQADVLIANILAGPLIDLAPHFATLVRPAGAIVLSGILPEQAAQVLAAYRPWFDMALPSEHEGWVRLEGCRK